VGSKSDVADALTEFGDLNYYDNYGNPIVMESSATNMSADMVIDKYVAALGGKDKLMQVKDLTMNMEADMMGQVMQMEIVQKAPYMVSTKMTAQGMTLMEHTENVDGKNAYVVEMAGTDGKKTNLFFDATTFLKIKEVSTFDANGQTVTMTNDLADYKEVDGILFPHTRITSGAMPAPLKMTVKEIKVNSGVADSFFKVE